GGVRAGAVVTDGFVGQIRRLQAHAGPASAVNLAGLRLEQSTDDVARAGAILQRGTGAVPAQVSHPVLVLGEPDTLTPPAGGWRTWSEIVNERHRWERNHRRDYLTDVAVGAPTLVERAAWLEENEAFDAARIV